MQVEAPELALRLGKPHEGLFEKMAGGLEELEREEPNNWQREISHILDKEVSER